jgi:hypothetical protein
MKRNAERELASELRQQVWRFCGGQPVYASNSGRYHFTLRPHNFLSMVQSYRQ